MTEDEARQAIEAAGGERVSIDTKEFDYGDRTGVVVAFFRGEQRFSRSMLAPGLVTEDALPVLVKLALEDELAQ